MGATLFSPEFLIIHGVGSPTTVELCDGTLLTVWYESMAGHKHAVLRQAKWRLE